MDFAQVAISLRPMKTKCDSTRSAQGSVEMSTFRQARRTVLSLCLSAWMTCLPILSASESCVLCQANCEQRCCCTQTHDDCSSPSQQCKAGVSAASKGSAPAHVPCSCACCQYRSVAVSAPQNEGQRTRYACGHVFVARVSLSRTAHPLSRVLRGGSAPETAERPLDRCVSLCRLAL